MKKQTLVLSLFMAALTVCSAQKKSEDVPGGQPPTPPEGFKWVVFEEFSDEFDGNELNGDKWHSRSPYWVHGRPPATFRAFNVSVNDGMLEITNCMLEDKDRYEGDDRYTIAGGAVGSVYDHALYGYYSVRMKASSISMSSTFWMKNKESREGECGSSRQELDIVEAIGQQKTGWDFRNYMKSNTHYQYRDCKGKRHPSESVGGECEISPAVNEAFHVYGCWWVDANTIKFYHNGEYKFTINPSTKYDDEPYNKPMYMHMVTETYDWESPPTAEELADDSKNTTYYDWVRSYKLVPVED